MCRLLLNFLAMTTFKTIGSERNKFTLVRESTQCNINSFYCATFTIHICNYVQLQILLGFWHRKGLALTLMPEISHLTQKWTLRGSLPRITLSQTENLKFGVLAQKSLQLARWHYSRCAASWHAPGSVRL